MEAIGVTSTTRRLLEYWTSAEREKKFFFCQIEALETAIYMTETASRYGDDWMEAMLREANGAQIPVCPGLHSRWQPAPARPWSWGC